MQIGKVCYVSSLVLVDGAFPSLDSYLLCPAARVFSHSFHAHNHMLISLQLLQSDPDVLVAVRVPEPSCRRARTDSQPRSSVVS